MPRRDTIGDWRCVERAEGYELWEHPEYTGIALRHDPDGPPGERWTWLTGERQGRARTNGDAFGQALTAAGAPEPKRPSGPSGKRRRPLCTFTQDPEDFEAQQRAAAAERVTWADWIRDAAARKLASPTPAHKTKRPRNSSTPPCTRD